MNRKELIDVIVYNDRTVSLDDIRRYRGLCAYIRECEDMICSLYEPVSSAPMTSDGSGRSLSPSNPTARAVYRIEKEKEKLDRLYDERDSIEEFVDNIDDKLVAAIIRHKFMGRRKQTWSQTERHFYKRTDTENCRKLVQNYFERLEGKNDKNDK